MISLILAGTECYRPGVSGEAEEFWADVYERLIGAQCVRQAEGMPQAEQRREERGRQSFWARLRSLGFCTITNIARLYLSPEI